MIGRQIGEMDYWQTDCRRLVNWTTKKENTGEEELNYGAFSFRKKKLTTHPKGTLIHQISFLF